MRQPLTFVFTRIKQAIRELQTIGPGYGLILILATIAGFLVFYKAQDGAEQTIVSSLLLIGMILSIHLGRSDHRFLKLNVVNFRLVFFVEYVAFLLPFILLMIVKLESVLPLLTVFPVIIISLISSIRIAQKGFYFPVKISGRMNFEWKAGFRKVGWLLVVVWIAAILLTPIPFVSMIVLWFMLLIISSFYEEHETSEMVEAYQMSPVKFICAKIFSHIVLFVVPASVVLTVSLYFFPSRWWIYLLFLVYSCVNIAVFIVSKYAVWGPGETHRSGTVTNVISLLGFFLPFLFPLPVFILIRNTRKAVRKLSPLLNDYA